MNRKNFIHGVIALILLLAVQENAQIYKSCSLQAFGGVNTSFNKMDVSTHDFGIVYQDNFIVKWNKYFTNNPASSILPNDIISKTADGFLIKPAYFLLENQKRALIGFTSFQKN